MSLQLQFLGATGEVTGSLYAIRTPLHTVLLECGLIQGGPKSEERNWEPLPIAVDEIDAVILSHAHIDDSGRVPLLVRQGYTGPIFVQNATKALCGIMLPDSGYLNEKDAEYANRKLVFSGDLGYRDAPVMNRPATITEAHTVLLESTYGDREHRAFADTLSELAAVFRDARASQGNILIPAFTVGRSQDLLYLMAENYERWNLDAWQIYLDSPMAIEATQVYAEFRHLYGARLFGPDSNLPELPNFHMTRTPEESMTINDIPFALE